MTAQQSHSRSSNHTGISEQMVTILDNPEVLAVIKEEQRSPTASTRLHPSSVSQKSYTSEQSTKKLGCFCGQEPGADILGNKVVVEEITRLLKEQELQLRADYNKLLEKELSLQKERFDFIVQNEEMRTAYMLREAHRERQEKIRALERQLECKNMAALMYVMCTERTRGKMEKLKLIEEYTIYIQALQEILMDGQNLILSLGRGYKTAARVDQEWREKMKKVIGEFMNFIYHFAGGPIENNQFFIDLPKLLKTETSIEDNPCENPCEEEEALEEEEESAYEKHEKCWWDHLDGDDRPFVVFGDMADFAPPQRRQVLKGVKAAKTVPKKWKQYRFNNLCLDDSCENADAIKDLLPTNQIGNKTAPPEYMDSDEYQNGSLTALGASRLSFASRRQTAPGIGIRAGDMGSLLRIITSANAPAQPDDKTALLGAVDSIEIASTTRLKSIAKEGQRSNETIPEGVKINIRRVSHFDDLIEEHLSGDVSAEEAAQGEEAQIEEEKEKDEVLLAPVHSKLNTHTDSLEVITTHVPEKDHIINYERTCPVKKCQLLQVDSFMRSLPAYMRANPFTLFEQNFEDYETCTKEQLEILRDRLEAKPTGTGTASIHSVLSAEAVLKDWNTNIATQTSIQSFSEPCTCGVDSSTITVGSNFIFDLHDLVPVKQLINTIHKECLHDERIEFNRFQVVGNDSDHNVQPITEKEFQGARARGITNILKKYPSLLDIFQANAQC